MPPTAPKVPARAMPSRAASALASPWAAPALRMAMLFIAAGPFPGHAQRSAFAPESFTMRDHFSMSSRR